MSDDLIVRSVTPVDLAEWRPLWEGYNSFYERAVPAEVTAMTWSRFFDAYEPVHALVAEQARPPHRARPLPLSSQHRDDRARPAICRICSQRARRAAAASDGR